MTDYSTMPIGTKIDDGEIKKCPHCGKRGLAQPAGTVVFYTHAQWFRFNSKNQPEVGWDACPKQKITVTTSRPEDL